MSKKSKKSKETEVNGYKTMPIKEFIDVNLDTLPEYANFRGYLYILDDGSLLRSESRIADENAPRLISLLWDK